MYFVYKCFRPGSLTLYSAYAKWDQTSDDMLAFATSLQAQGFDVEVFHGGLCACYTTR